MTKTVYIIRHAKSNPPQPGGSDFSRTLSDSGFLEIQKMARTWMVKELSIDAVLCSTSMRTRQTAMEFIQHLRIDENKILYLEELYHATSETLKKVISRLEDRLNTIVIVAHNPGITEYVNEAQTKYRIDDVPTCGIIGIQSVCKSWNEFEITEKETIFFGYPGMKN